MKCPNCGAEVFVKGSQWECGWCGNCGRLAPVPQPAPTVRLTIRPQTQSASPSPAGPKNAPAPWTSPTWQLRLKNYFAEDPSAALALWREALDAAGPQLQCSRTTAEQLLPNVIQRPWLYENDQIFQSASVDSLQLDLLRACNHLHRQALGTRLLALLRQNPFPTSAWQMPPSRYEQALARGLSGKKPR